MIDHPLLFIDTNTGGPDPDVHSLLQIGLGVELGNDRRETDVFIVREPDIRIDPRAARIHGITAYHCEQAGVGLAPREAARRVLDFISKHLPGEGASLCGWNVGIDRAFLRRLFRLAGEGDWLMRFERSLGFRSFDLPSALRFLVLLGLTPPFADFAEACEHLGVLNEKPHDSQSDAVACMDLLRSMRAIIPGGEPGLSLPALLMGAEVADEDGKTDLRFRIATGDVGQALRLLGQPVRVAVEPGAQP